MKIPFYKPSIGAEEIEEVVATLKSGWLTTGPKVKQFEREFRAVLACRCQSPAPGGCRPHVTALPAQNSGKLLAECGVVIHHEDACWIAHTSSCSGVAFVAGSSQKSNHLIEQLS